MYVTSKTVLLAVFSALLLTCQAETAEDEGDQHAGDLEDEGEHLQHDDELREHNAQFHHEAFLGKEEAESFDELAAESSKQKLMDIFVLIDTDDNGEVDEEELKQWVKGVQRKGVLEGSKNVFKQHDSNKDGFVSWDEYKEFTYGPTEDDESTSYAKQIKREQNKFKLADGDGDLSLSQEEFSIFWNPENYDYMRGAVAKETFADLDEDGDGSISLDEYIEDMWPKNERDETEGEPDWIGQEKQKFSEVHDQNKDGRMDAEEVKDWIATSHPDYEEAISEARYLMLEADGDGDGKLTKEEVTARYDVFVGSHATNFGEMLNNKDEL